MPYKEEGVEEQETRDHLHRQPPAGRGQLREARAPQQLEDRRGGQHRRGVLEEDPPEALVPLPEGRRRARARRYPPRADALTHASQRVQHEERCAEREVREEGAGRGQVRGEQDLLVSGSHALPESL